MAEEQSKLQIEIEKARSEIRSDEYSMSIGEWINLYQDNELDIHPEFQRFFRWSDAQKTRLIESILLGIPIPPIFVAQQESGVWDVVDGLQRLSTIFQLVGILKDENGKIVEPLELQSTKYLRYLQGMKWENNKKASLSLNSAQKLLIKRSKISVSIILKESDKKAKYELFQRLNTGGTSLSAQEVRNSIIVMMNPNLFRWLKRLSTSEDFQNCIALSENSLEEQYDLDLLLRFIILRKLTIEKLKSIGDIGEFLTEEISNIAEKDSLNYEEEEEAFVTTFRFLNNTLGDNSCKRYDITKQRFMGGFLISSFEVVAIGAGNNYRSLEKNDDFVEKVKSIWINPTFTNRSGSGVRASSRLPITIPLGRNLFKK